MPSPRPAPTTARCLSRCSISTTPAGRGGRGYRVGVRRACPLAQATGHRQSPAGTPLAGPDSDPRPAKAQPPTVQSPGPGGTRVRASGAGDEADDHAHHGPSPRAGQDRTGESRLQHESAGAARTVGGDVAPARLPRDTRKDRTGIEKGDDPIRIIKIDLLNEYTDRKSV